MKLLKSKKRKTSSYRFHAIINADDFGISTGVNKGIEKAFKKGILTSASIMPTGPAFKEAVNIHRRNPSLGIGVHLSLTWGKSVLSKNKIPDLIDDKGYFYASFLKLFLKAFFYKKVRLQIKKELDAQIKTVIDLKIKPDHLNGQVHAHFLPYIFPIVLDLSKKHKIKHVRIPSEKLFALPKVNNLLKWSFLKTAEVFHKRKKIIFENNVSFFGVLFTSNMNKNILAKIIRTNKSPFVEILLHPGERDLGKTKFLFSRQKIDEFILNKNRKLELLTVLNKSVISLFEKENIKLTTFGKIL